MSNDYETNKDAGITITFTLNSNAEPRELVPVPLANQRLSDEQYDAALKEMNKVLDSPPGEDAAHLSEYITGLRRAG